jgi:hypothetical protein
LFIVHRNRPVAGSFADILLAAIESAAASRAKRVAAISLG